MHTFLLRAAALATVTTAAACATQADSTATDPSDLVQDGHATITFAADGSMKAPATLVEGQTLTVKYELGRHSPCSGQPNEVGIVDDGGHASTFFFDDQAQFCPTCFYSAHIVVPAGRKLSLWATTGPFGGDVGNTCFDSNGGKNFVFPVAVNPHPLPTITFGADQSMHATGALVAGAKAQIRYSERRTGCPVIPNMMVEGASRTTPFDSNEWVQVPTGRGRGEGFALFTFTVPKTPHVSFWFESNGSGFEPARACSARFDSNGGKNFTFPVSNP